MRSAPSMTTLVPGRLRHLRPIDAGGGFRRVFVAGEQRKLGGKLAMSQRNPRVIGRRHQGGNARHDLERHAGVGQLLRFLAAAAEEIGVAANEPHNGLARARPGDEQLVQFVARRGSGGLGRHR